MPWKIVKRGPKWCTVKKSDGSTVHCFGSREQAVAQLRALYSSESKDFDESSIVIEDDPTPKEFVIYKDASGTYRWEGTYSNDRWDRDKEQLSAKAHQNFVKAVELGVVPYPELWLWHIPVAVGQSDTLSFSEERFSKAAGYFHPKFNALAEALSTRTDLGMSHGMPNRTIVRNKDNPNIIDFYVSREVSVLPRDRAANYLTEFKVEGIMPLREDQQTFVDGLDVPQDVKDALESQHKEVEPVVEKAEEKAEVATEPTPTPETTIEAAQNTEVTETPKEKMCPTCKKPMSECECEDDEEEEAPKKEAEPVEPEPEDCKACGGGKKKKPKKKEEEVLEPEREPAKELIANVTLNMDDIQKAINAVTPNFVTKEAFDVVIKALEVLPQMVEALSAMQKQIELLKQSDEDKIKSMIEGTPTASLADLQSKSVIGNKFAKVDGRTKDAKDTGPAETASQRSGNMPCSFLNGFVSPYQS